MYLVVAKIKFHDNGDSIYITHSILLSEMIHDHFPICYVEFLFALFKRNKSLRQFLLRFVTCIPSFVQF